MAVKPASELGDALRACRGAFIGVGLISGTTNILYLTGSFFMLEVYDRVIPSRSVPTLLGLGGMAALLYAFQGILEFLRGRVLVRIGNSLDEAMSERVYDAVTRLPLKSRTRGDGMQPLRDLDQLRAFLSGTGPAALMDMPWMPLYLAICFMFHPLIGLTATAGGAILVFLTVLTELWTRQAVRSASEFGARRNALGEASRRNAEVLQAMGMGRQVARIWGSVSRKHIAALRKTSDVAGGLGSASKVMRMLLQSLVLGVGAYLVINQQATAGIMIASSILTSRALAPVELAIANWRGFVSARQSRQRLNELLQMIPASAVGMELPAPDSSFVVEHASAAPPGVNSVVVHDVNFRLEAGQGLGVIGPSASGKSSLARLLVGVWTPVRGKVRLDGAALDQWPPEALGRHIGYLPQDVELFEGTIKENVSRFVEDPDPGAVVAAAKAAGVHEMILRFADGYDTKIGEGGAMLSAGQRQRLALARALFGAPFLVVLDEPNSNLDAEGDVALTQAIQGVRRRGGIVVVIAHRPAALVGVDLVLMMSEGKMQAFGPKDEVLSKVLRPPPQVPLKIVPDRASRDVDQPAE